MKLLIRNLNRTTTEAELLDLFEEYGSVQSLNLVRDEDANLSKGFGFVNMPKAGEAKVAMQNLNGKIIAGFKIRVKKAEPAVAATDSDDVEAIDEDSDEV
ncbi:RNA recognition motif domain-containing protein [Zhongshania aquimaris]|uniref:RNA-binding protein n=1 Tax=Zhongshania aquimaris TaxID=2857107 RepID=A0ABS6VP17_9GAMM|nr:RNA-binding protein [Zhongshania aquimaris]MBW2939788.1 RNA-binding protein [Zhongshania aquimaris]